MSALTDPGTFQLHDLAERDVRDDPIWRDLMGLADSAPVVAHLPGKHNQADHGRRKGLSIPDVAAPKASARKRAAPKDSGTVTPLVGRDFVEDGKSSEVAKKVAFASLGKSGRPDSMLELLAQEQGFDGKPQVVDRARLDELVAAGHVELWRGLQTQRVLPGEAPAITGGEHAEQFRTGGYYAGYGGHGNGIYTSDDRELGLDYAHHEEPALLRMTLHPDAKVVDFEDLHAEHATFVEGLTGHEAAVYNDVGRYAIARGVDAIRHASPESAGHTDYVILNRTAVVVEEAR